MRRLLAGIALSTVLAQGAMAANVGVSMALFDDNFLTVLRNGMQDYAATLPDVTLQVEDAQNDVGKQLNQIQNFVASGVDAIIVNPVDTDATQAMTAAAEAAGIPLVYVNRQPVNVDRLPANQAFVASREADAGRLQAEEACRLLKEAGTTEASVVILMGELSNQGARMRTQAVEDVLATPECGFMTLAEKQTGNWQRTQGADLVTNWLTAGVKMDVILSNNDEMAIGAVQALKAAGVDPGKVIVGGIDATPDALAALRSGDLDLTVFQDAKGQGAGAVDTALKLARGEASEQTVYIPFELVTKANIAEFAK